MARDRSGRGVRYACALTLLAASSLPVSAQLPFEVIGLGEGLPQSQLPAMAQARDGFLWIGTVAGVARWRDRGLAPFPAAGTARCRAIARDANGRIWLGTEEGVLRCADDSCVSVLGGPQRPVTTFDVLPTARGTHAATDGGLYRIEGSAAAFEEGPPALGDGGRALAETPEGSGSARRRAASGYGPARSGNRSR